VHRYFNIGFVLLFFISTIQSRADEHLSASSSDLSVRMFYSGLAHPGHFISADSTRTEEQSLSQDTAINKGRLALVGGTLFGSMVVIHIYQQNGWWKDNRAPFHFQEDLVYGLGVDKIGHFYGAYLLGFAISKCAIWSNVSEESAMWIGSAGGLLFQTYVEVEDGFSTWGFDRVDFASDVGGAAWPIARHYVPYLQNFDLKLSYHTSSLLGEAGGSGFKGQKHLLIDDYEGQTLWMGIKVHNILPEQWKSYWPDFLNLAVGYGARDVAGASPHRVFFLAPDLDMTKIIPPKTSFLKTLGEALNFIHMPLPAVRFSPDAVWYGIYF
jgi:hypothetical protein